MGCQLAGIEIKSPLVIVSQTTTSKNLSGIDLVDSLHKWCLVSCEIQFYNYKQNICKYTNNTQAPTSYTYRPLEYHQLYNYIQYNQDIVYKVQGPLPK